MMEKIEWYQEVLELEPSSKVFFPLARLLQSNNQLEEAIATLCQGLDRHPEFFEARLMLIDLLERCGRREEAIAQAERLGSKLNFYLGFWQAWAGACERNGQTEISMALRLVAAFLSGRGITMLNILQRGLNSVMAEGASSLVEEPLPASGKAAPDISEETVPEPAAAAAGMAEPVHTEIPDAGEGGVAADVPAPEPIPAGIEPISASSADIEAAGAVADSVLPAGQDEEFAFEEMEGGADSPAGADQFEFTETESQNAPEVIQEELVSEQAIPQDLALEASLDAEPAAMDTDVNLSDLEDSLPVQAAESSEKPGSALAPELEILDVPDGDPAEHEPEEEPFSLRTKTMAGLLVEQGDLAGALEIYEELLAAASTPEAQADLQNRIAELKKKIKGLEPAPSKTEEKGEPLQGKDKLLDALENLARRLEMRAGEA